MSRAVAAGPPPTAPSSRRLRRERLTVQVMISMYCAAHHAAPGGGAAADPARPDLCLSCAALLDYATGRIDACRFGAGKPTCARCTVHCFRAREREAIRQVMRYSGPRMVSRHPYLAVRHLLDRHDTPEAEA